MKIPNPNDLAALINKFHEDQPQEKRYHMGASLLGHHCDRWLWLNFRWAVVEKFPGRILRLFRRGQDEEAVMVSDLREIGIDVRETGNKQRRVIFGGHVEGSMDGVIVGGMPESRKAHILEGKTHNKKSFDSLEKDGVEKAKPMHFVQMQCYMYGSKIDRGLYYAVCKNDDRIYTERVRLVPTIAKKAVGRGQRIALLDRMPEPCPGASEDWYQCKFCPAHEFCHLSHTTKEVNCRTCAHCTINKDSVVCERWDSVIPNKAQEAGCRSHVVHPDLVPWKMTGGGVWTAEYDGILNGEDGYSSKELLFTDGPFGDYEVDKVRSVFGGEIVK